LKSHHHPTHEIDADFQEKTMNLKLDDRQLEEDNNKPKDAEAISNEMKAKGSLKAPDDVQVGGVNKDILEPKAAVSYLDMLTDKSNQEKTGEEAARARAG
jgi:hypothetical protein